MHINHWWATCWLCDRPYAPIITHIIETDKLGEAACWSYVLPLITMISSLYPSHPSIIYAKYALIAVIVHFNQAFDFSCMVEIEVDNVYN